MITELLWKRTNNLMYADDAPLPGTRPSLSRELVALSQSAEYKRRLVDIGRKFVDDRVGAIEHGGEDFRVEAVVRDVRRGLEAPRAGERVLREGHRLVDVDALQQLIDAVAVSALDCRRIQIHVTRQVRDVLHAGAAEGLFDPLAFRPVTQARFGTAGYYAMRGPGAVNLDLGLFRQFAVKERLKLEFRAEAFNAFNTPHFALPGSNVSNMLLNADGTIRNLAGYTQILGTENLGRDFDERHFRFGLRVTF